MVYNEILVVYFMYSSVYLKWQPAPIFLPRESQGQRSLVGCRLWGLTESDTTEATWQQQQQKQLELSDIAGGFSTAAAAAKSLQSCLTLCDPIDGSPPGSSVPGILQARTLEWVAISFSNA